MKVTCQKQFQPVVVTLESFEELNIFKNTLQRALESRAKIKLEHDMCNHRMWCSDFLAKDHIENFSADLLEKLRGI